MKKLFVSVPMKGRTEEEIRKTIDKMKKIAEIFEGEELELIESYIEDNPPKDNNQAIWFLGESLKKLAQADVFIGISEAWDWSGCQIERETAERYGIKRYFINGRYVFIVFASNGSSSPFSASPLSAITSGVSLLIFFNTVGIIISSYVKKSSSFSF